MDGGSFFCVNQPKIFLRMAHLAFRISRPFGSMSKEDETGFFLPQAPAFCQTGGGFKRFPEAGVRPLVKTVRYCRSFPRQGNQKLMADAPERIGPLYERHVARSLHDDELGTLDALVDLLRVVGVDD